MDIEPQISYSIIKYIIFFITSTNIIFVSLYLCCFVNLDQIIFPYRYVNLFFEHNQTISSDSLSSFYQQELPPIFNQISSFRILSFYAFPYMPLTILISTTLILWICYFLIAKHSVPRSIANHIIVLQNFPYNFISIMQPIKYVGIEQKIVIFCNT